MKTVLKTVVLTAIVLFGLGGSAFAQKNDVTSVFAVDVTCNDCKAKIEKNIGFQKGVKSVDADVEKDIVTVTYKAGKNSAAQLSESLKALGYENTMKSTTDTAKCAGKADKACCKKGNKPCCAGDTTKCKKGEAKKCCKGSKKDQ